MTVTAPTGPADDDAFWRRPPHGDQPDATAPPPAPTDAPAPYAGPPTAAPPPPGWRPPTIAEPPPPRHLPPQDHEALDDAESAARTVTYGVGMVAAAVLVIVVCLLCARLIF